MRNVVATFSSTNPKTHVSAVPAMSSNRSSYRDPKPVRSSDRRPLCARGCLAKASCDERMQAVRASRRSHRHPPGQASIWQNAHSSSLQPNGKIRLQSSPATLVSNGACALLGAVFGAHVFIGGQARASSRPPAARASCRTLQSSPPSRPRRVTRRVGGIAPPRFGQMASAIRRLSP